MARGQTRKAAEATPEASKAFDFSTVEVGTVAELPKAIRETSENPLAQRVADALDAEPQFFPVPNGETAIKAANLLRRAANEKDWGVKVRYLDASDASITPKQAAAATDTVYVVYKVTSTKVERKHSERKYTVADVRAFHGLAEDVKVTQEQRNQYRESLGLTVRS